MSPGRMPVRHRWVHSTCSRGPEDRNQQGSFWHTVNILRIKAHLADAVPAETSPRLSHVVIHGLAAPRAVDPGRNSDGFKSKVGHVVMQEKRTAKIDRNKWGGETKVGMCGKTSNVVFKKFQCPFWQQETEFPFGCPLLAPAARNRISVWLSPPGS